jgi:hypothetical protein
MSTAPLEMALSTPSLDAQGRPSRVPLGVAAGAIPNDEFGAEPMLVNIGPSASRHSRGAAAGLELEGRRSSDAFRTSGYLHSGFEKLGVSVTTIRSSR